MQSWDGPGQVLPLPTSHGPPPSLARALPCPASGRGPWIEPSWAILCLLTGTGSEVGEGPLRHEGEPLEASRSSFPRSRCRYQHALPSSGPLGAATRKAASPGAETLSLTDRRNTCSWVPPLGLLLGEMAGSLNC